MNSPLGALLALLLPLASSAAGPPLQPCELQLWYHQTFAGPFLRSCSNVRTDAHVCGPRFGKKQLSVGARMSAAGVSAG